MNFYEFPSIPNAKEFKNNYRAVLDNLGTTTDQEKELIEEAKKIADNYINEIIRSKNAKDSDAIFPEDQLNSFVDNTWGDTGKAIFNNWLGLVYSLTSHDRLKQYMEGIDKQNPLGILK